MICRVGGRFISLSTILDSNCKLDSMELGYNFSPCYENKNEEIMYDGIKTDVSLYSEDMKSKCCFPNYLWKIETIRGILKSYDFTQIDIVPVYQNVPVSLIKATKKLQI